MRLGDFVVCTENRLGTGSLIEVEGTTALVEYFDSIAASHRERLPIASVLATTPQSQTRCYWRVDGHWQIGRIQERSDDDGFLVIEHQQTQRVLTRDLRVRWARSVTDPIEILIARGSESPLFHRSRLPFIRSILRQRAVSRGLSGVLSSRVELHRHQVETARRVLEDPLPRYLLADEVGLGKTIEAGFVVRQFLLDNFDGRALVLTPPYLVEQWKEELERKFALADFNEGACQVASFDDTRWLATRDLGLLVVDEAHHVAHDLDNRDLYERIRKVAHATPGLLLLSATPVLHNEEAFLALLHLLDPRSYKLDDVVAFRSRVLARGDLGRLLLSLQESTPWYYLPEAAEALGHLFPEDNRLVRLLTDLADDPEHTPEEVRRARVRAVRVHLSETHRVYRRLLRTRRSADLDETFPARGRLIPAFVPTNGPVRIAADRWLDEWRDNMLLEAARTDESADRHAWLEYVFTLLLERATCSLEALVAAVRLRLGESVAAGDAGLSDRDVDELRRPAPTRQEAAHLADLLARVDPSDDERIPETVRQVRQAPAGEKVVVFCSFSASARSIAKALTAALGPAATESHIQHMRPAAAATSVRRFRDDTACRVLVCDRSAEEGQNLQFASRVLHFDLPVNPNRLEQRLGRLDRYGSGCAVPSVVLLDGGDLPTFHDAWARSLAEDFQVFERSIATYHFAVDSLLPGILRRALHEGAMGLAEDGPEIRQVVAAEARAIAEHDVLDSIEAVERDEPFFEEMESLDAQHQDLQEAFDSWVCRGREREASLQIQRSVDPGQPRISDYSPKLDARHRSLVPADWMLRMFPTGTVRGTFARRTALRHADARLLRLGEPFYDAIQVFTDWDDRGRTFAFWRYRPEYRSRDPEWAFRFDYVVEADPVPAAAMLVRRGVHGTDQSLRRQLDGFLAPLLRTIWLDAANRIVADDHRRKALQAPYQRAAGDVHLRPTRFSAADALFGSVNWEAMCRAARKNSEEFVLRDQGRRLEEAYLKAKRVMSGRLEMLRARSERMRGGTPEAEDTDREAELMAALLQGIRAPVIRLEAVGFIVLAPAPLALEDEDV